MSLLFNRNIFLGSGLKKQGKSRNPQLASPLGLSNRCVLPTPWKFSIFSEYVQTPVCTTFALLGMVHAMHTNHDAHRILLYRLTLRIYPVACRFQLRSASVIVRGSHDNNPTSNPSLSSSQLKPSSDPHHGVNQHAQETSKDLDAGKAAPVAPLHANRTRTCVPHIALTPIAQRHLSHLHSDGHTHIAPPLQTKHTPPSVSRLNIPHTTRTLLR